jgi:peptidoglycan/LPS O-acetylase OafA/YrhL
LGRSTSIGRPGPTRDRLPFAGALRALATISIVVYHAGLFAAGSGKIVLPAWLATLGAFGVACFFALSGFLLARPYVRSLLQKKRLPDWPGFARDRFLRIYPLYAFLVIVMWLASPWLPVYGQRTATFGDALTHLAFIFPFFHDSAQTIDPPMWTMSTDVQFYFALPLLCAGVTDLFKPSLRARGYAVVVGVLVVLSMLLRFMATPYAQVSFYDAATRVRIFGQLFAMFTAFGGGMIAALVWESTRDHYRKMSGLAALAISVPFLVALTMLPSGAVPLIVWSDVIAGVGAPALVLAGCSLLRGAWVENPAVRWAERLSYAIYLTHFFVVEYAVRVAGQLQGWNFFCVTAAGSILASAAIALPLYLFVERPFLQLKERLRAA